MFSDLVPRFQASKNTLYSLRHELETAGTPIVDLVSGNVSDHGILFPQDLLEEILIQASRSARHYHPDSFGLRGAREAIESYYRSQEVNLSSDRLMLTPGTSVSYWYAFKLLANPGDEILCPRPSYPLFDYIAELTGVRLVPYQLRESCGWAIDLEGLEAFVSTKTRALILISPHNPTGHVSSAEEVDALCRIALRHDLAIISDEVFNELLLHDMSFARPATGEAPLVITLNGLSKMFALPGMKVGWMALSGSDDRIKVAMKALELISDTFLPVNEYAQASVEPVLERGRAFLEDYVRQIRKRWNHARSILAGCRRFRMVEPAGGFYVTLSLEGIDEESSAEALLRRARLLVHPGYFYDIPPHHLVLSFVQSPAVQRAALAQLVAILEEN